MSNNVPSIVTSNNENINTSNVLKTVDPKIGYKIA